MPYPAHESPRSRRPWPSPARGDLPGRPADQAAGHNNLVLLNDLVVTSAAVAGSSRRGTKIAEIAALLQKVPAAEVPVAVAFLSGELTQRQIGVGYAALMDLIRPGEAAELPPVAKPTLTLTQTDEVFAAIGRLSGPGSQAERRALLATLLSRATPGERDFLVRLLAGDLGQGALAGVMAEAVAKAAGVAPAAVRRANQVGGSLPEVAAAALAAAPAGPAAAEAALAGVALRVGRPVRPMLAASAADIDAAFERISPAAVEWKIDGIRIQVHRQDSAVCVFTRTLDDITSRVPEIVSTALSLGVRSAVLDGEAVALYPDGRPRPFQVTSARAASHTDAGQQGVPVPLTTFLFDLLHVDGTDLIDAPAAERYRRLAAVTPPTLVIPRIVTADPAEATEFYLAAVAQGHEGVVVKSLDAPYGVGRRGGEWVKVKPRHTLDLVVLAAEWGHGRRRGWLSNLHLGARDPATGGLVMLGKTFKGLTDEMLAWQTARLLELADPPQPPLTEAERKGRYGTVWVRPELVAEIAFDGVQASRRYPGGVALRFARVLRYRPDKPVAEADTIDTIRALWDPGQP
jgi:ATP-dependent DNA ligase I